MLAAKLCCTAAIYSREKTGQQARFQMFGNRRYAPEIKLSRKNPRKCYNSISIPRRDFFASTDAATSRNVKHTDAANARP